MEIFRAARYVGDSSTLSRKHHSCPARPVIYHKSHLKKMQQGWVALEMDINGGAPVGLGRPHVQRIKCVVVCA